MKSAVLCISVIIVVSCNALSLAPAPGNGGKPAIWPRCGPVCKIFCTNGNVLDSRGCPTCRCKPETNCKRSYSIRSCRFCQYGRQYYTDRNGCRQCKCKTRPVDVCPRRICKRACRNGYKKNSKGCNTCICNPSSGRKSCRYNGRTYKHGSSFMKQCNRCRCLNGRAACTRKACRG